MTRCSTHVYTAIVLWFSAFNFKDEYWFKCTRPLDIIYQQICVKYLYTIYVYCILSHWQIIKIMLFVFNPHLDFIHMQKCPVRIIMTPGEMCHHCFLIFINKHYLVVVSTITTIRSDGAVFM